MRLPQQDVYKSQDIESVHGQISGVHLSVGDQKSAEYQRNQVHHALEEQLSLIHILFMLYCFWKVLHFSR